MRKIGPPCGGAHGPVRVAGLPRGEESPEGESWPLQELAQEPSSWKRCEHVPGRGNCGERERGTFQNTPEGQMAGSKTEGELVGSEVT